jgi:hypothetical protein
VACNRWIPLASLSVPIKSFRLSPTSSCEERGRRRKCTWEKFHLPSSLSRWPYVSGSDTCRWTRIFRLFLLSSGVTFFLTQFAYLIRLRNVFWTQVSFEKNLTASQDNSVTSNRRFEFHKRSQLFIRSHNETVSVVAVRICNEDRSPVGINRCDAAPTPAGPAEIGSDDFPILHSWRILPLLLATQQRQKSR